MSYQVLARKWRPLQFKDLVGQTHVATSLTNAISQERLHHAYLFTGTRGVGKTTIARIFAKCLNCELGISATPCGQCGTCLAIESGRFADLLEIDAASKTKVEDTREILENVLYAPTQGRYKIYLIDEVHMLSGHSFNALLKTLEEPPEHVKFILATTDPQKLPVTVLSRCLQFQLKPLNVKQLTPHLSHILTQENIAFEPNALELLAEAAKGSVRDALSLLDQAIAAGAGNVSFNTVSHMLGFQGQQLILPLAKAVLHKNIDEALQITTQLSEIAVDFMYVLDELIKLFHDLSIKQLAKDFIIHNPLTNDANLLELSQYCDAKDLQLFYQIALLAKRDIGLAPSLQIGFEMALLRMMAFRLDAGVEINTPQPPPKPVAPVIKPNIAPPKTETPPWENSTVTPTSTTEEAHITKPIVNDNVWHELLPALGLTALSKAFAEHLHFERRLDDHFYFSLAESHAALLQDRHRQRLITALTQYFNKPITLTIQLGKSKEAAPSLVEHQAQELKEKKQAALDQLQQDKNVQKILTTFDGVLLKDSLELHE